MLGVIHDFAAVSLQESYGLADQQQVFLFRNPERPLRVEIPALSEDGNNRRLRIEQFADVRILIDSVPRESRRSERREFRVPEPQLLARAFKELFVFGIGTGPSAFDVVDPQLIELLSN